MSPLHHGGINAHAGLVQTDTSEYEERKCLIKQCAQHILFTAATARENGQRPLS